MLGFHAKFTKTTVPLPVVLLSDLCHTCKSAVMMTSPYLALCWPFSRRCLQWVKFGLENSMPLFFSLTQYVRWWLTPMRICNKDLYVNNGSFSDYSLPEQCHKILSSVVCEVHVGGGTGTLWKRGCKKCVPRDLHPHQSPATLSLMPRPSILASAKVKKKRMA